MSIYGAVERHPALRWYKAVYRLVYRLGLAMMWERAQPPTELIALVVGPNALPAGRALDLGCGVGTDACYLAAHGWDVTGVDVTPEALVLARRKAAAAGVTPRFLEGDVTRLADLGVGQDYTLLVDIGCFHSLPADRRAAYVTEVSRAAQPGATLLLLGFRRFPRYIPAHAGMTPDEVRQRFCTAGWEVVESAERSVPETRAPRRLRDHFVLWAYQLRRSPG